jgi:hypothetical protein
VRHGRRVVLERIADIAVFVGKRSVRAVVQLVGIVDVIVPLVAVVFPRDVIRGEMIADAPGRRGWNRERRVGGILIDEGILAVAEPAGVVVVEQIVVALLAARVDRPGQRF